MINILSQIQLLPTDTAKVESLAKAKSQFSMLSMEDFINKMANGAVDLAIRIAIAVAIFYIGKFIINRLYRLTKAIMVRREIDPSLTTFILSLLKIALLFLLIVIVIGVLGIETSSFIAIFASAGVAIGLALSGTLQNFAGGVLILLIKPYKVGDFIEVQGYTGTVKEIQIFNTVINTPDNKSIIIPNGGLSTGNINNYSKEEYRRVDWKISIGYGDNYQKAKEVALRILAQDDRIVKQYIDDDKKARHIDDDVSVEDEKNVQDVIVDNSNEKRSIWKRIFHHNTALKEKAIEWQKAKELELMAKVPRVNCEPFVALGELADSSINIVIRAWTRSEFYWGVYYDINEKIYDEFPKEGLNFPFPQVDVHVVKN
ncbi:MAG: mechanosensitive ion channel [Muribaculaceae bacterium]